MGATVLPGNCLEVLRSMPDASIDAIVTDPPYGLTELPAGKVVDTISRWASGDRDFIPDGAGFMSNEWDRFVPPPAVWDECFRVLKPGGHMVVFSGGRTMDLMGMSIRFAGFDLRAPLHWHFGTGKPAGVDVAKMVANAGGDDTQAATWEGWNTTLKPATEPILVARRPLAGSIGENVLEHGTGGFNIEACRAPVRGVRPGRIAFGNDTPGKTVYGSGGVGGGSAATDPTSQGRYPADVILTHHAACRPAGDRVVKSNGHHPASRPTSMFVRKAQQDNEERTLTAEVVEDWDCVEGCPIRLLDTQSGETGQTVERAKRDDSGGASRFYTTTHWSVDDVEMLAGEDGADFLYASKAPGRERPEADGVRHVTVKPLAVMRWLVKLLTPAGGVVLDPFTGSGTTLEAALIEGFDCVGIEREAKYLPLIQARIDRFDQAVERGWVPAGDLYFGEVRRPTVASDVQDAGDGQLDLFAEAS